MQQLVLNDSFLLEQGGIIQNLTIAYHTYGTLNDRKDNVIWICHALTASSDAASWWPGLVQEGAAFDTTKYFIVCANILGSCYGTTGPLNIDPATGKPYYLTFPFITIRDMVQAHRKLREHLGIQKIHLLVGGSMGGYQALEWCVMEPALINRLFLITTSAKESAWGKAIHAAQRMAIETDASWKKDCDDAGKVGMKTARAIGMITYRNYTTYVATQEDEANTPLRQTKAASYIEYQGTKFMKRFNAYSYWHLTHVMDSHHLARGRNKTLEDILEGMEQKSLIISINSDILCPVNELQFIAKHLKNSTFFAIDSLYGHDGFLTETAQITKHVKAFLSNDGF